MIRVSVMYPHGEGKRFDHGYFAQKHMPLVRERLGSLGLIRYEIDKGVAGGTPGSAAPFVSIAQLYFDSVPDFQQAMQKHGKELLDDIPNYTNIQPQIQISEIAS
jgi:uncharacterized protein (TIGR02118 family)